MAKYALIIVIALIVILAVVFFLPDSKVNIFKKEPVQEFNITIYHTRFNPVSISVNQDDLVRLNLLTAPGTKDYKHGITIEGYGINQLVTSETTPTIIEFKADKKGTFPAYCGTCLDGPFGRDVPDKRLILIVN